MYSLPRDGRCLSNCVRRTHVLFFRCCLYCRIGICLEPSAMAGSKLRRSPPASLCRRSGACGNRDTAPTSFCPMIRVNRQRRVMGEHNLHFRSIAETRGRSDLHHPNESSSHALQHRRHDGITQDHRKSWKFLPIQIGSYVVLTKTAADLDGEISLRCSDHTVGTQSAHFQA